jgi:hypothetical protein
MTNTPELMAGVNFPWKYITGYFMLVRSFTPLTQILGDKVGTSVLGTFGVINAELPNPDVESQQRILSLPIKHKSDFKSIYRAHIDSGIKNGTNELVILYEHRRNLLGRPKACFHVAIYPAGTWNNFFEAVVNYKSQEFKWPRPLLLYQPSPSNIFPTTKNIFRN